MKKLALFCAAALALSTFSVGCTTSSGSSTGSTSWCRSGSLFPTARSRQNVEHIYATSSPGSCDPCEEVMACGPCEPVCDPCAMSCTTSGGVISSGITPHPSGM